MNLSNIGMEKSCHLHMITGQLLWWPAGGTGNLLLSEGSVTTAVSRIHERIALHQESRHGWPSVTENAESNPFWPWGQRSLRDLQKWRRIVPSIFMCLS